MSPKLKLSIGFCFKHRQESNPTAVNRRLLISVHINGEFNYDLPEIICLSNAQRVSAASIACFRPECLDLWHCNLALCLYFLSFEFGLECFCVIFFTFLKSCIVLLIRQTLLLDQLWAFFLESLNPSLKI